MTAALIAMTVLALDPTTDKPGRVHERGNWWRAVETISGQTAPTYREVLPTDCGICSRPLEHHSPLSKLDDHEYEPISERKPGVGPTSEQRAAIDKAIVEAELARTAQREEPPKREPREVADVLATHTTTATATAANEGNEQ